MILEILIGVALSLAMRALYFRALFVPHPFARYVIAFPFVMAAAAGCAVLLESLAQAADPRRRRRPIYDRAFAASLFLGTVLLIEAEKIGRELGGPLHTLIWAAAPFVSSWLSLMWIRCRRDARYL